MDEGKVSPIALKEAVEDLVEALSRLQKHQEMLEVFIEDEDELMAEVNRAVDFEEEAKEPKIRALILLKRLPENGMVVQETLCGEDVTDAVLRNIWKVDDIGVGPQNEKHPTLQRKRRGLLLFYTYLYISVII
eukprot:GHVO01041948.1.p1 GENE.GHVO01041948.1~~GHVO01041948.1.p1  ORF type:complete len:133 (-),score=21.53 GHVO01041948.1:203-601(-)